MIQPRIYSTCYKITSIVCNINAMIICLLGINSLKCSSRYTFCNIPTGCTIFKITVYKFSIQSWRNIFHNQTHIININKISGTCTNSQINCLLFSYCKLFSNFVIKSTVIYINSVSISATIWSNSRRWSSSIQIH